MVSTEPTGVQVYLDDEFKGVTSEQEGKLVVGNIPARTYELRVSKAGHKDWTQSITVGAGEELRVQAKLVSAGPTPLTLKEVEDALANGVPKGRLTALVNQYGVNFVLSNEAEQSLRNAGADSDLLLAIAKPRSSVRDSRHQTHAGPRLAVSYRMEARVNLQDSGEHTKIGRFGL